MAIKITDYKNLSKAENIAVGISEDGFARSLSPVLEAEIKRLRQLGDLKGKKDELHIIYPEGKGPCRLILCGLGKSHDLNIEKVRKTIGRAIKKCREIKQWNLTVAVDSFALGSVKIGNAAQAAALAGTLAIYQYCEYKSAHKAEEKIPPFKLYLALREKTANIRQLKQGEIIAEGANFARTLGNHPGNRLSPRALAKEAISLGRKYPKITVRVKQKPELSKQGFGALLGVGSGSINPPVLIECVYKGGKTGQAPVGLVGKGITFDSGGISIKPSAKMDEMRYDMCGAAAVLGIIQSAAELKLPLNLVGIIPAAENLPSATAYRPGDILTSLSGQTIEVLNTDAEGRLVLADALTYIQRFKPDCIIDLATLTGAVIVALGHIAIGLVSNNDKLSDEIKIAARDSGERVWRLPLWDEYRDLIKSEVADVANISSKSGAGTITASAFLEKFINSVPWVHLDIAGTAWGEAGAIYSKGATGSGVRLIMEWLMRKAEK
ncbi:leucyl aminopeptidase [bacterium]|nr:leucyl aminopeptidase [bacterium]